MSKIRIGILISMLVVIGIVTTLSYQTYLLNREGIPNIDYMKNIPPKPADWDVVMREINSGYVDISKMGSAYYLQPDFYPGWNSAMQFYEEHDYSRWGVYGHGAYPANPKIVFNVTEIGSWISFGILYKPGYGIETWQGLKLVPEENEYFNVKITPDEFLLEPTFPVFSEDWVRPLNINISIKQEPPKGEYFIHVNSQPPSKENSYNWFWEVLKKESTLEEREMIVRAKIQAEEEGEIPEEFQRWVEVGRKNKYVDSSQFQMSPRITIKITVL